MFERHDCPVACRHLVVLRHLVPFTLFAHTCSEYFRGLRRHGGLSGPGEFAVEKQMLSVWDFKNRSNDDDGADTLLACNCLMSKPAHMSRL